VPGKDVDLEALLKRQAGNIALIVGNGINRFNAPAGVNSWETLLMTVAHGCGVDVPEVPKGTAPTEFYDVVELKRPGRSSDLAADFCKEMSDWRPVAHHRAIMGWASRHDAPVLTTNFDEVLSEAGGCTYQRPEEGFSDYYPWRCHFAPAMLAEPCEGFGIWHINGMARYKRSIRLGLSHYMGSVQRSRAMFLRGQVPLFSGLHGGDWEGAQTWLQIFFNKPLLIFGLGLEENEVFLRWLLIQRARHFREFEALRQPAWYVYTHDPKNDRQAGKHFLLDGLGIHCIRAPDYNEIYENRGWLL
jgi:hypothetical protein